MTARWRPKTRKQILQLNDEEEGPMSPIVSTAQPISIPQAPSNKLHALLGHYNSDDDSDNDTKQKEANSIDPTIKKEEDDAQFKDFMDEIKSAETPSITSIAEDSDWQELWDPQSGHPYYWNQITNELTWEKPQELLGKTKIGLKNEEKKSPVLQLPPPGEETNTIQEPLMYPTILTTADIEPDEKPTLPCVDFKVSFKLSTKKTGEVSKKVSVSIDVDAIIAEIEKEVPPDHKSKTMDFVPLFKRRKMDNGKSAKSLPTNFKTYFFPSRNDSILPLFEEPASEERRNMPVNSYQGFGFQESNRSKITDVKEKDEKIQFVKGDTLLPMVVVEEPTPPPILTLEDKIQLLPSQLPADSHNLSILTVLVDAWKKKKLETDYFETWVDGILQQSDKTVPLQVDEVENEDLKIETETNTAKNAEEDQVIDMVLDDSGSEKEDSSNPETPSEPAVCIDSALDSFYSDLATLDSEPVSQPVPEQVTTAVLTPEEMVINDTETSETQLDANGDVSKRSTKRSKMSQDMSSLVAKWQKINNGGKT